MGPDRRHTPNLPARLRQRGVALLTVLFMLVLLTTLVVFMVEDEHLAIRRASNQRDVEQSFQMAAGTEQWVAKILERDMRNNDSDHLQEDWNTLEFAVKLEEGKLSAQVFDLQGRFNINNLAKGKDQVWYPAFQRLLRVLGFDEGLADAVVDWVDDNQDVTGSQGAEDAEYLSAETPYRSANQAFANVGELIWVKGFDEKIVATLAPVICALPATDLRININTAPVAVLRILSKDLLPENSAQALVDGRGETGYKTTGDFLTTTELAGEVQETASPLVGVTSRFFEVHSRAVYGRFTMMLYSILERRPDAQQVVLTQRRRGIS